jgi:mannose-1-phosphate guanylyltransferase/mannose-6-phosphate isomerase
MDFSSFTIKPMQTFYDALVKIENNKKGFLIVVDEEEKVIGTLTDGDIRRSLINQKA